MPVSAFFAVTLASGTPAPEGSFTCPTIVLVIVWPQPKPLTIALNSASFDTVLPHNKTLQVMYLPPGRANPCIPLLREEPGVTKHDITGSLYCQWRYNMALIEDGGVECSGM